MEEYKIPDQVMRPILRMWCRSRTVEQSHYTFCRICNGMAVCDLLALLDERSSTRLLHSYCSVHCKEGQEFVLENAGDFFVALDGNDRHDFGLKVPANQERFDQSLKARLQAAQEGHMRDETSRAEAIVNELVKYQMDYNRHMFRDKDKEYPKLAEMVKELDTGGD